MLQFAVMKDTDSYTVPGTYRLRCGKCNASLTFSLDGGPVTSVYDTMLRCPICSKYHQIYRETYRTRGCKRYDSNGLSDGI